MDGRSTPAGGRSVSVDGHGVARTGTPFLSRSGTPALSRSGTPALSHSGTPALSRGETPTIPASPTPPIISLCPRCAERAEQKLKEGFDKLWDEVPRIFGVERWEVLGEEER
ncbi:hypothetical protein BD626DRAFT_419057 [Schizophyllum amplum]|uniref:Uncharacterized protein n=1 Tax=Schizophyllum amplum TaxID=97359 RepID=A0A550BRX5_9AGAR|nr:hypothetical protein BD626DRAFT_419057 [Auriculariopsis ampla]